MCAVNSETLRIEKVQVNGITVHLIGIMHGQPMLPRRVIFGPTREERKAITDYIESNNIKPENSVLMMEKGPSRKHFDDFRVTRKDLAFYENVLGLKLKKYFSMNRDSPEIHKIHAKEIDKRTRASLKRLIRRKPMAAIATGASLLLLSPIIAALATNRRLWDAWHRPLIKRMLPELTAIQRLQIKDKGKGLRLRDFAASEVVDTVSKHLDKNQQIVLFHGIEHTEGTKRFLVDSGYRARYAKSLETIAEAEHMQIRKALAAAERRIKRQAETKRGALRRQRFKIRKTRP